MVRMKNKIVCFFGILFIILCMPFHIYAEADAVPGTLEEETGGESIVTCKVKSFYSDDVIPQPGDTFYIEYENSQNEAFRMVLDASESVESWKEIEITPGDYTITKITYIGENTEILQKGYCISSAFSTGTGSSIELGIGEVQANRIHTEYRDTLFVPGLLQEDSITDNSNADSEESDIVAGENSNTEKEEIGIKEPDHPTADALQKNEKSPHYEKSITKILIQNIPVFVIAIIIIILFLHHFLAQKRAGR